MWEKFAASIAGLSEAYTALIKISKEKRAALVTVDMKKLSEATERERAALVTIKEREDIRRKTILELSKKNPAFHQDMTMNEVMAAAPREIRDRLKKLHGELGRLVSEAQEAGDANEFLIRNALGAVQYHLNRIAGTEVGAGAGYGTKGEERVSSRKNLDYNA